MVEIDYVEPHKPSDLAVEALRSTIKAVTEKRTVSFLSLSIIPAQSGSYGLSDLERIHNETFESGESGRFGNGTRAELHVLYLNGEDANRSSMGVLLTSGAIILFPETFEKNPGPVSVGAVGKAGGFSPKWERHVLIHEFGHAVGLVDCGVPSLKPHSDPTSKCHSSNPKSVMAVHGPRPSADPEAYARSLTEDPAWQFDEDDLADLAAYRKASS